MSVASQTYTELFKLASESTEVEEAVKLAVPWWAIPAVGVGAGGTGLAAGAALGNSDPSEEELEEKRRSTRNLSFGAGLASGLVAPHLLQGLASVFGDGAGRGEFTSI